MAVEIGLAFLLTAVPIFTIAKNMTLERLNRLLPLFDHGFLPPKERHIPCRIFGIDPTSAIRLLGDNVGLFDAAVEEWLDSFPALSRKMFLDKFIPLIRAKLADGGRFTQAELDQFRKTLDLPLRQFRVLRPIYGIVLPKDSDPVQFGDFLIYPSSRLHDQLKGDIWFSATSTAEDSEGYLIECEVESIDADRAVELADMLFYRFELIMRILIGVRTQSLEVGIVNYGGPHIRKRIVLLSGRAVSRGSSWEGALQPIPLSDAFFANIPTPFLKLFQLISRKNSEVEKHVLRCAEWTGQAMGDPNAASAFVKAAIALEVLFSVNERGVITPSIMAQIAESCAYLLADSVESAMQIEREVKRLYGIRSAVVHSGKDSVKEGDLRTLIQICRGIIVMFLSSAELTNIQNMAGLSDYLKRKKFSACGRV